MRSYSINIYMPVDFKKPGMSDFQRTGSLPCLPELIYELQHLIQYKCSTSLEAEFHGASKSAIVFFIRSTGERTSRDLGTSLLALLGQNLAKNRLK